MSTEPTPTAPSSQPDWAVLLLFALLAGGAVYALYHAFSTQAALNRQLTTENRALAKRVQTLEAVQGTSVRIEMLERVKRDLADSRDASASLRTRLEAVEKLAAAPAPVIHFTPAASNTELLQQFAALKRGVEAGEPFAPALQTAGSIPAVQAVAERLAPLAEQGIATEPTLRDDLAEWLEANPATITVEDPQLESFNARLKGLLTVRRKQAAPEDAYATLRAQSESGATLDVLIASARALDSGAREPLAAWLECAEARQSALGALRAAEAALAETAQ